jgi:hypothetical protein
MNYNKKSCDFRFFFGIDGEGIVKCLSQKQGDTIKGFTIKFWINKLFYIFLFFNIFAKLGWIGQM